MENRKVLWCTVQTADTFKELGKRTRLDMMDILEAIAESIQKQLDLMKPNVRLSFMSDLYIDKQTANLPKTIIRLSDANSFGLEAIPSELRNSVLKAFDYSTDGKFTDLRTTEQPKLTHCEAIKALHDREVAEESDKA